MQDFFELSPKACHKVNEGMYTHWHTGTTGTPGSGVFRSIIDDILADEPRMTFETDIFMSAEERKVARIECASWRVQTVPPPAF